MLELPKGRASGALHVPKMPIIGSTDPGAIYTGRLLNENFDLVGETRYGGELHLMLFGPNGTGKGTRILVPNLLTMQGKSIVAIDPKGQLTAMTAKYRHQTGNDVKIIDPFGVVKDIVDSDPETYRYLIENDLVESVGFNPLALIDPDSKRFYEDAAVVAGALIKIQGNDPHWSESARGLVTGLIMWECKTAKEEGRNPNLENIRFMLTQPDEWETFYDPASGKYREGMVGGLSVTASKMVKEGGFAIASLAARFKRETPTDEMESVRSAGDTQTEWLLSEIMRDDLKKNGVDFRKLKTGEKPMTVYVVIPSDMLEDKSIWLRLVVSEALRASMKPNGRRVLLMLDEFAALGHLQIIEKLYPVCRDYRVQMWPILQDPPQLKRTYPDSWRTLLNNVGVLQSFRVGVTDIETAEWLSKISGNTTVMAGSHNSGTGYNYSNGAGHNQSGVNANNGISYQETSVPFLRPEIFFGLPEGVTVGFMGGQQHPFMFAAERYDRNITLTPRVLANPYHGEEIN